nr:hypothetical protein [Polymorphobacter sp.]
MTDPVPAEKGFDFNQPTVVALMYLVSIITGLSMLIGLVLAYVWKDDATDSWENSHFRFHIRSFWIGLLLAIIAVVPTVLTLGIAGFILYPLLVLWLAVRSLKALVAAQKRDPIIDVETWLW